MYKNVIFSIMICVGLSSCVTVRPGEVGMVQTLGRLSDKVKTQGPVFYNPFTQRVVKTSIQTSNPVSYTHLDVYKRQV